MTTFGTATRFGWVAQTLHWLTAILVLAAFLTAEGGPTSRVYSDARAPGLQLHETLGLAVFVLVLVRLAWRLLDRTPQDPPMPAWMSLASKATHWALFGLLVLVPVTAVLGAWFGGHPVTVYGLGAVGPLLGQSDAGAALAEIHGTLGDLLMWIAGLHAAAALYHHFFLRDGVLKAMLPVPDA